MKEKIVVSFTIDENIEKELKNRHINRSALVNALLESYLFGSLEKTFDVEREEIRKRKIEEKIKELNQELEKTTSIIDQKKELEQLNAIKFKQEGTKFYTETIAILKKIDDPFKLKEVAEIRHKMLKQYGLIIPIENLLKSALIRSEIS